MTFRVPDQSGYQPDMVSIDENQLFDAPLSSDLDVVGLCQELALEKWDVELSTDPGRFLCNYVYYNSLCLHREKEQKEGNECRSLFIHLPSTTVMALTDQISFVKAALNAIVNSIVTSNA